MFKGWESDVEPSRFCTAGSAGVCPVMRAKIPANVWHFVSSRMCRSDTGAHKPAETFSGRCVQADGPAQIQFGIVFLAAVKFPWMRVSSDGSNSNQTCGHSYPSHPMACLPPDWSARRRLLNLSIGRLCAMRRLPSARLEARVQVSRFPNCYKWRLHNHPIRPKSGARAQIDLHRRWCYGHKNPPCGPLSHFGHVPDQKGWRHHHADT